jgi:hypothetical protein
MIFSIIGITITVLAMLGLVTLAGKANVSVGDFKYKGPATLVPAILGVIADVAVGAFV